MLIDQLQFEPIQERDILALAPVMRRAFDHDARLHLGVVRGGPPGYDDGEYFRRWLFPYEESHGYKILLGGRIVGGLIVWIFESGHNRLGTIFVDPACQDRGLGTRAWQFVEATYPDAVSWELGTSGWALKNHHFYVQKCGFEKVGEEPDPDCGGASYLFRKYMCQNS